MQDVVGGCSQSSTALYPSFPANCNQHHTTSCSQVSALQYNALEHLFGFASWGKVGGANEGVDRAAFMQGN